MVHEKTVLKIVVERYAERHGVTMREIARKLSADPFVSMGPANLSHKLAGRRELSLHEAHALASLLGMTMDALYELVLL